MGKNKKIPELGNKIELSNELGTKANDRYISKNHLYYF